MLHSICQQIWKTQQWPQDWKRSVFIPIPNKGNVKDCFNCWFLTCIQISQEADQVVWNSHLFQNYPQFILIHTVKGFSIVNKAEIDVILELSCFFDDPVDVCNLISGSFVFENQLEHLEVHSSRIVEAWLGEFWALLCWRVRWVQVCGSLSILWHWNENWPFPVLWPLLSFPNLLAYWVQHFNSTIF